MATDEKEVPGDIKFYQAEIRAYKRIFEDWEKKGRAIIKQYRDDDSRSAALSARWSTSRYNLLWANVQTLQPALYSKLPRPECERRYKDRDPIARLGAEIAERVAQCVIQKGKADHVFRRCRDDYLLPGRGQAWLRYESTDNPDAPVPVAEGEDPLYEKLDEKVCIEYVQWDMFGHNVACSWDDVRRVWREIYLDRVQAKKRFGDQASKFKYTFTPKQFEGDSYAELDNSKAKKACIYELWDSDTKTAYWFEKDATEFIEQKPDPLRLQGFFPCPRPIYSTITTDSLVPVAFFVQYKERLDDLNKLMKRRRMLIDAIKAIGVYDSSQPELAKLFHQEDLKLIPSNNWPQLAQAGGLKGVTDFVEIKQYVDALRIVNESIAQEKDAIFELSAVNDTMRGYADPQRTAKAEQIQGTFTTLRLEDAQKEIARFTSEVVQLATELALEHFEPMTIAKTANLQEMGMEAQQAAPDAILLLKNDKERTYRVSIETDSMLSLNETAEKQRRTEALDAYGRLLKETIPLMQQTPGLAPMFKEILMFGIRTFKGGRSMEFAIEQSIDQLIQQIQQQAAQGPPPSPEQLKLQADQQAAQIEMQMKQADMQMSGQQMQADLQLKGQELQLKAQEFQMEQQAKQAELQQQMVIAAQEMEIEREKLKEQIALEREKLIAEIALEREKFQAELALKQVELQQRQAFEEKKALEAESKKEEKAKKKVTIQHDPMTKTSVGLIEEVGSPED